MTDLTFTPELYKQIVEHSVDVLTIMRLDGYVEYESPSVEAVLGYTPAELIHANALPFLHPMDLPVVLKLLTDAATGEKKIYEVDVRFRHKNGVWRYLGCIAQIIELDGSKVVLIHSRDITKRLEEQKLIEKAQKRFTFLTENLSIGVFTSSSDKQGRFTSVNSAMVSMFEARDSEEMMTHQVSDLYQYPEKRQIYIAKILNTGYLKNEKIEFITLKGNKFIGNASAVQKTLDDGTVLFDGIIEDVTKQEMQDRQMVKITRAVEQSPDSIVITDKDGLIEYINPFFTQNTGYTKEEAIGQNPRILKSGENSPETYIELWKTISSGNIWRGELKNKKKNGELYWESISISPILDANGVITNYVAVKADITKQKATDNTVKKRSEDMEHMNALMVGRELKMIDMKKEIESLRIRILELESAKQ